MGVLISSGSSLLHEFFPQPGPEHSRKFPAGSNSRILQDSTSRELAISNVLSSVKAWGLVQLRAILPGLSGTTCGFSRICSFFSIYFRLLM